VHTLAQLVADPTVLE